MTNKIKISNAPLKGMSDWFPEDFLIRKYIFDSWRKICKQFGYHEYLTPLLENADIYKAKSGEDVGGKELMTLTDRAGRELAIRPEMTPSVTRLVSRIYPKEVKPIRYFSIANYARNEKPQKGRNREFWQLNYDIFGSNSIYSDIEILQMAIEIILSFNPPANSFEVLINSRNLVDDTLESIKIEDKVEVIRILDKYLKLTAEEFQNRLFEVGLNKEQVELLEKYMSLDSIGDVIKLFPDLQETKGVKDLGLILNELNKQGYANYIKLSPSVLRGLDYYDGMIFEVFDKNPDNRRSMFGGGRYNGLSSIFGVDSFPAVGCAPGDETMYIFLQNWGLIEKIKEENKSIRIYFPVLEESLREKVNTIIKGLRNQNYIIEVGLDSQPVGKALQYANSKNMDFVILYGKDEADQNSVTIKNMISGEQQKVPINEISQKL